MSLPSQYEKSFVFKQNNSIPHVHVVPAVGHFCSYHSFKKKTSLLEFERIFKEALSLHLRHLSTIIELTYNCLFFMNFELKLFFRCICNTGSFSSGRPRLLSPSFWAFPPSSRFSPLPPSPSPSGSPGPRRPPRISSFYRTSSSSWACGEPTSDRFRSLRARASPRWGSSPGRILSFSSSRAKSRGCIKTIWIIEWSCAWGANWIVGHPLNSWSLTHPW